jgi:choline dehydrogenase-like flavoprotein
VGGRGLGARNYFHHGSGHSVDVAAVFRGGREDKFLGFGDIDFRAASLDGYDVDWPITYGEIAPYYSRVERMIGVSSTVQNRPSNPDGEYLPPFNFRCLDHILQKGAEKIGVPYLPDRIAQLTENHEGHPACHYCGVCTLCLRSFWQQAFCMSGPRYCNGRESL